MELKFILNNKKVVINCDLIEYFEASPDTIITLTTGNKFVVRESTDELINKVVEFRQKSNSLLPMKKEDINNG